MEPHKIRLFVSDVDGTLLNSFKKLSPSTIKAIRDLRRADIHFSLVSHRPLQGLRELMDELQIEGACAALNGGVVVDQSFTVIAEKNIRPSLVQGIVGTIERYGLDPWIYTRTAWYVPQPKGRHVGRESQTLNFPPTLFESLGEITEPIIKIAAVGDEYLTISECGDQLRHQLGPQLSISRSLPNHLDVSHPDANKGAAVTSIAVMLGIPLDQVATAGDGENDIPMFRVADSAEANLKEARLFEDRVRKLVDAGEASRADLAKATLERSVLEQAFASSGLEAQLASHDLASFWTTDADTALDLKDILDDPPLQPEQEQTNTPYLRRLEFKIFDAQAAGFRADAHQARAQLLPQLSLSFQYGIDALQVESRDRGYAGFVHLEIPVFDWFRARSETHQFQLRAQQVETDKAVAIRIFSKDYADALAETKGLYAQLAITDAQVTSARDNLRLSRLRFEGGEGTALEVVTAQNDLVQAQINYYTTRANYLNARVTLDVASGR